MNWIYNFHATSKYANVSNTLCNAFFVVVNLEKSLNFDKYAIATENYKNMKYF